LLADTGAASYDFAVAAAAAETCNSTMLPNGDFEENEWEDYKLKSWIKVKEFGSQVRAQIAHTQQF
jgi:hypothetical protein